MTRGMQVQLMATCLRHFEVWIRRGCATDIWRFHQKITKAQKSKTFKAREAFQEVSTSGYRDSQNSLSENFAKKPKLWVFWKLIRSFQSFNKLFRRRQRAFKSFDCSCEKLFICELSSDCWNLQNILIIKIILQKIMSETCRAFKSSKARKKLSSQNHHFRTRVAPQNLTSCGFLPLHSQVVFICKSSSSEASHASSSRRFFLKEKSLK